MKEEKKEEEEIKRTLRERQANEILQPLREVLTDPEYTEVRVTTVKTRDSLDEHKKENQKVKEEEEHG